MLVISKYALDCQQFETSATGVTWKSSSLRKWLNDTFINDAFSKDEQKRIKSTTVTADRNPSFNTSPGSDTTDKVFLLSIAEVNKYFNSNEERKCVPTNYVVARGALTSNDNLTDGKATCLWWLRSPGRKSNCAAFVYSYGTVYNSGSSISSTKIAVRPAMWIASGEVDTWGVVGSICGTAWNKDYPMTNNSQGVYESDPLELKAGDEFRIRKDGEWTINRGIVEEIEESYEYQVVQGGSNIKVKADGLYRIRYDENTERLAMIPVSNNN